VFSVCATAEDITAGAAEFFDAITLKPWRKRKLSVSVIPKVRQRNSL
jgi:hypothetical protein